MEFDFTQATQHAPRWLNAALTAILGYWAASLVWWIVPVEQTQAAPAQVSSASSAPVTRVDYGQSIASRHVFGEVVQEEPDPVADVNAAPETNLDLTLKGVLLLAPKERSQALISVSGAQQKSYLLGENVTGGAELADIYTDRVIIKYRGRFETLMLEGVVKTDLNVAGKSSSSIGLGKPKPTPVAAVDVNQNFSANEARKMREQFIKNPASLMSKVKIKQVTLPDNRVGFSITPKREFDLFYRAGLRENDVIVSVNGNSVTNIPAMNGLQNAEQYNVTVVRNGVEVPLTIRFK